LFDSFASLLVAHFKKLSSRLIDQRFLLQEMSFDCHGCRKAIQDDGIVAMGYKYHAGWLVLLHIFIIFVVFVLF
jgi:hypothetical protein